MSKEHSSAAIERKDHLDVIFGILKILACLRPREGLAWCFRGQSDQDWPLIPKVGRSPLDNDKGLGRGNLFVWEQKAVAFETLPDNPWERMAIAQHHGLATRLLDWTYNPLVALYFSANEFSERDGGVYVYSPNSFVDPQTNPFDLPSEVTGLYMPRNITPRIHNQSGIFTYHSNPKAPLPIEQMEGFTQPKSNLSRITIKSEWKPALLDTLDTFGINQAFLFPGLDGLSRHINWKYHQ